MRIRRDHMGTGFEVWDDHQTWFWSVISSHRNGGAIGEAAREDEAVREACQSIEEIAAQQIQRPQSLRQATDSTPLRRIFRGAGHERVNQFPSPYGRPSNDM